MKFLRAKIIILLFFMLLSYFFSNDFGLIDIEKTAIVTAIAVDIKDDDYNVTLQIAIPQGGGSGSNENDKAVIEGTGKTVAEAIGNVGSVTGWFPNLSFCNLILIGEEVVKTDVLECLDYFARSIKVQDSAILASTEGEAKEVLKKSSPLDNISSFALQKIILKKTGMDGDVLSVDIKTFAIGYFSRAEDTFMPYITEEKQQASGQNNSGKSKDSKGSDSSKEETALYNASRTLLFKKGVKVGELDEKETTSAVLLKTRVKDSSLAVKDVMIDGESCDFLLRIIDSNRNIKLKVDGDKIIVKIKQNIYVKVADETTEMREISFAPHISLPKEAKQRAEELLYNDTKSLTDKCKKLKFDIFGIDLKLYRYHHKDYKKIKDKIWDNIEFDININVHGQDKV